MAAPLLWQAGGMSPFTVSHLITFWRKRLHILESLWLEAYIFACCHLCNCMLAVCALICTSLIILLSLFFGPDDLFEGLHLLFFNFWWYVAKSALSFFCLTCAWLIEGHQNCAVVGHGKAGVSYEFHHRCHIFLLPLRLNTWFYSLTQTSCYCITMNCLTILNVTHVLSFIRSL